MASDLMGLRKKIQLSGLAMGITTSPMIALCVLCADCVTSGCLSNSCVTCTHCYFSVSS